MDLWIGLIGAVVTIIPGLMAAISQWLQTRDERTQAVKEIELGLARVKFAQEWISTQNSIGAEDTSNQKQVLQEFLDKTLLATQAHLLGQPISTPAKSTSLVAQGRKTWFLAATGFTLFSALATFYNEETDQFSIETFTSDSDSMVGLGVFICLSLYLLYRWRKAL